MRRLAAEALHFFTSSRQPNAAAPLPSPPSHSDDPCNAFINAATCNTKPSCVWRSYGTTSWSMPSQGGWHGWSVGAESRGQDRGALDMCRGLPANTGWSLQTRPVHRLIHHTPRTGWCSSLKDTCFDHRFDREACSSNPSCRAVPRCARSYCEPSDACCLIHSATECKGTAGCASGGWCGLAYSPCWNMYNNASCSEQDGCEWRSYSWGEGADYGWCQVRMLRVGRGALCLHCSTWPGCALPSHPP